MPYYDYTAKKNKVNQNRVETNKIPIQTVRTSTSNDLSFVRDNNVSPTSIQYQFKTPEQTLTNFQIQNSTPLLYTPSTTDINQIQVQQNPNQIQVPQNANPIVQYRAVIPQPQPVIQVVKPLTPPKTENKAYTVNMGMNTEDIEMLTKGTQIEKDLVKTAVKSINTDLKSDQIVVKGTREKVNHFNEGFRTYYDHRADVLGVMCFLCCANRWNKCNNICRGCRNAISCPVYCWCCCIIPIFILLLAGILVAYLIGSKVIKTS